MSASRPAVCALALALCLSAAVAHSVYQIPIQPTDTLEPLVKAAIAPSASALLVSASQVSSSTLRPTRFLQTRWLEQIVTATGWTYHAVFRGTHALLAIALILLFVHVAGIRTWPDLAALGVALLVLLGMHTFAVVLREAYPVNHYLEVSVAALAVVPLARARPSWWTVGVIAVLLAFCLPLIESGILVWVAVLACAVTGMRGIDRRAVVVSTVLVAAYFIARQALQIQMPGIGGHGSGFGGRMYSEQDLLERFGSHPAVFAAYNIAGSLLSVLFSEPRNGVFATIARNPATFPGSVIHIVSAVLVTIPILWYVVRRLPRTRANWTDGDRAMIVALMMIVGSTPLTLSYVKDEVLSTAGVFYALAAYVAARVVIARAIQASALRAMAIAMLLLAAGSLWTWRVAGMHYQLRITAFKTRNDWDRVTPDRDAAGSVGGTLQNRIRSEALERRTTAPAFLPSWGDTYWIE